MNKIFITNDDQVVEVDTFAEEAEDIIHSSVNIEELNLKIHEYCEQVSSQATVVDVMKNAQGFIRLKLVSHKTGEHFNCDLEPTANVTAEIIKLAFPD
mgnify:CR=1 FL=1